MTAASSACSQSDISSDIRGQISATASASPFISSEMRYCTFVSNIFRKATLPFSTASTIAPSRTDSRGSAQSTGDPIMAAVKKCLSAIRPPERTFTDGAVSVFLSASSHDTSPYNAREHIHRPPGKRDKIWACPVFSDSEEGIISSLFGFKVSWGLVVKTGMESGAVVEGFDVMEDGATRFG